MVLGGKLREVKALKKKKLARLQIKIQVPFPLTSLPILTSQLKTNRTD